MPRTGIRSGDFDSWRRRTSRPRTSPGSGVTGRQGAVCTKAALSSDRLRFALTAPLDETEQRGSGTADGRAALSQCASRSSAPTGFDLRRALLLRGLLFCFALSVTSDVGGMVPTGRRADSL